MEGLFSHFFSAYRPNYHVEDVQWFLELANHQYNWCTQFGEKTPMNGAQKNIFEWVKVFNYFDDYFYAWLDLETQALFL